ncbi:hypothetical protein [Gemmatimonas sp.]
MPRPFVIYAQGRTGSHLLMSLLASHPQVECAGEVLNREQWRGPWQLARRVALRCPDVYLPLRARRATRRSWGCKVPIATSARGLARLASNDWLILFLQRRSRFDRALSWCVASLTGQFQRSRSEAATRITVPEPLFRDQLEFRRHWDAVSQGVMRDIPHLPLMYEDHLAVADLWPSTGTMLFTHLELPHADVQPATKRSLDKSYRDVVTNFDALHRLFVDDGGDEEPRQIMRSDDKSPNRHSS